MSESLGESPDTFQLLEDTFGAENTPKFQELVKLLTAEGLSEDDIMGILDEVEGYETLHDFVDFVVSGIAGAMDQDGEFLDYERVGELIEQAGF